MTANPSKQPRKHPFLYSYVTNFSPNLQRLGWWNILLDRTIFNWFFIWCFSRRRSRWNRKKWFLKAAPKRWRFGTWGKPLFLQESIEVIDVLMNFCLTDKFGSGKRGRTGYGFRGNIFWKGSWLCFFGDGRILTCSLLDISCWFAPFWSLIPLYLSLRNLIDSGSFSSQLDSFFFCYIPVVHGPLSINRHFLRKCHLYIGIMPKWSIVSFEGQNSWL